MESLILALHIVVCVLLVILILLQAGKEGMGVIFGGGNTSVFGSSGAGGLLAKMTAFVAVVFVGTSLSYTYVTGSHEIKESEVVNIRIEETIPTAPVAPAKPVTPPAAGQQSAAPASAPVAQAEAAAPELTAPAAEAAAPAAPAPEAGTQPAAPAAGK